MPYLDLHSIQVEVVFPSSDKALLNSLGGLKSQYHRGRYSLTEFCNFAKGYVDPYAAQSKIVAQGLSNHESIDVWCLDSRGILTILAEKQTYEKLGLVGVKPPWKDCEHLHVIRITLASEVPATKDAKSQLWHPLGAKQKALLEAWDQRRGPWETMYCIDDSSHVATTTHEVLPQVQEIQNVKIPERISIRSRPSNDDDLEDWEEDLSSLFEWVGMACLGSERLKGFDRPDPFIGVYTLELPSVVGSLTHIRWCSLLAPAFLGQIFQASKNASFVAIIGHSVASSPVGHVSPHTRHSPTRVPRDDSEDCWSLVLTNHSGGDEVHWVLAETIGQWDARWG